jgi:hypothetical protein
LTRTLYLFQTPTLTSTPHENTTPHLTRTPHYFWTTPLTWTPHVKTTPHLTRTPHFWTLPLTWTPPNPLNGDDVTIEGDDPLGPEARMEQDNILEDTKMELLSLKGNSWADSKPLSFHIQ